MAGKSSGAAVITGASTGIGRATALYLDRQGYRVFAGVRKEADAQSLADDGSDRLTPITIDVTEQRSISSARETVEGAVGKDGLVGLINNAGVGGGGPIETTPLEEYRDVLEVNLIGQIAVTQAFLPLIRRAKGTIVFIASIGGRVASPFLSPYNSSKFGIEALGESLRHELRPWGIDVVIVEPGSIDTEIWGKGEEAIRERVGRLPEDARLASTVGSSPASARRSGRPPAAGPPPTRSPRLSTRRSARTTRGIATWSAPTPRSLPG
jgi:NAD(P)-dependent dehydrogenase (short-subunit alcohol dehydrogenase family)